MRVNAILPVAQMSDAYRQPTPLPSSACGAFVLCYEMQNGQGVTVGCPTAREGIMRAGTLMKNPACRFVGVYIRGSEFEPNGAIVHWRETR